MFSRGCIQADDVVKTTFLHSPLRKKCGCIVAASLHMSCTPLAGSTEPSNGLESNGLQIALKVVSNWRAVDTEGGLPAWFYTQIRPGTHQEGAQIQCAFSHRRNPSSIGSNDGVGGLDERVRVNRRQEEPPCSVLHSPRIHLWSKHDNAPIVASERLETLKESLTIIQNGGTRTDLEIPKCGDAFLRGRRILPFTILIHNHLVQPHRVCLDAVQAKPKRIPVDARLRFRMTLLCL
mmetsp:Transcript_6506/g.11972  ORF Transcript_6506/g.11972 Transcript_6506/m.11972 type:complete len:235 (-) Transcript_6506:257-961(-)